jgi:hypothetical protein
MVPQAFGATGAMEGAWFKATGQALSFSEQQLMVGGPAAPLMPKRNRRLDAPLASALRISAERALYTTCRLVLSALLGQQAAALGALAS